VTFHVDDILLLFHFRWFANRAALEAMDQWQFGGKDLSHEERQKHLTPTGLLMEGHSTK
jgi:hypothetical protein